MIVFGGGCLNVRSEVRMFAFSRLTEVTVTTVPAGTTTDAANTAGRISHLLSHLFLLPHSNWCRRSRCNAG